MGHSYTSVGTCLRRSNNGRSLARRLTVGVGEVEVGNLPASKDPGCICSCCVIIILKFQVLGGGQRGALRMSRTKSVRSRVRSPYDAAYDVAPCRSYGVVRCRTVSYEAGSFVVRCLIVRRFVCRTRSVRSRVRTRHTEAPPLVEDISLHAKRVYVFTSIYATDVA